MGGLNSTPKNDALKNNSGNIPKDPNMRNDGSIQRFGDTNALILNQESKQNQNPNQNQNKNLKELLKPKQEQEQKQDDTSDVVGKITEFEEKEKKIPPSQTGGKRQIPMIGGNGTNITSDISYGLKNSSGRKRYTKYDLFKILKDLDVDTEIQQQGGDNNDVNSDVKSDSDNANNIKNIILQELKSLETNNQTGGLGCGCDESGEKKNSHKLSSKLNINKIIIEDMEPKQLGGTVIIDDSSSSSNSSSSSSTELGKSEKIPKSKKSKSKRTIKRETNTDSHFHIETSESESSFGGDSKEQTSNSDSDSDSDSEKGKKGKTLKKGKKGKTLKKGKKGKITDSEEGLSIFPFNSSDVKSSLSVKNYRMLRRKI